MPARAMWKGAIRLGMLTVPVKLYSAVRSRGIHFRQLHDQDLAPIRHAMVCPVDDEEVPPEHRVKGYEVRKGEYLLVEKEEMAALEPEASREIRVEDFVARDAIDPSYFDNAYYLGPDTGGADAYRLLVAALKRTKQVAVARWVMRKREYLGAITLGGKGNNVLYVETLHHHDEMIAPDLGFDPAKAKYSAGEKKMAQQLVESLTEKFKPDDWSDEFTDKVMDLIERKARGDKTPEPAARHDEPEGPGESNLTRILRESIRAAGGKPPPSVSARAHGPSRAKRGHRRTTRK